MKFFALIFIIFLNACSTYNSGSETNSRNETVGVSSTFQPGDPTGLFIATFYKDREWLDCIASVAKIDNLILEKEWAPLFGSKGGMIVVRANQRTLNALQANECVKSLEADRWNGPFPAIGVSN